MKWHYFNEKDTDCWFYKDWFCETEKKFHTICGRPIKAVKRHTENKGQVDCLGCLKRLNYKINKGK